MYYTKVVPLKMLVVLMGLVLNDGDRSERWKITTRPRDNESVADCSGSVLY